VTISTTNTPRQQKNRTDENQMNAPKAQKKKRFGTYGGLIAILTGIATGCLIGVVFGRSMWIASGGLERAVVRLQATRIQKLEFAAEATKEAASADGKKRERLEKRAQDLKNHVVQIDDRVKQYQASLEHHNLAIKENSTYALQNSGHLAAWELVNFCGDIFLQMLKMLVIPLVITSMICGMTTLGDVRKIGKVGRVTLAYYMITAGIAVATGIALVLFIQPGVGADDTFAYITEKVTAKENTTVLETLLNVFRGRGDSGSGMFPSNLVAAAVQMNVLALITFAIVFGALLTTLGEKGKVVVDFFHAANEIVMKIVHLVMYLAPIGIFGLVAANIAKNGGGGAFLEEISRIGWYVGTVMIGLAIHICVLGAIMWFIGRRNPFTYTFNLLRALLTAVSTASSSATLPVTMECVEQNNGISNRTASFVLPLGATVNMDGTALYEAVAVIFIAQTLGMDLSLAELCIIFLTATLAAIGAAGIPEAGLVTMVIVLTAVGLPVSGIGTILAIDWFLDRLRTTVNVYGDALGAGVVETLAPPEAADVPPGNPATDDQAAPAVE